MEDRVSDRLQQLSAGLDGADWLDLVQRRRPDDGIGAAQVEIIGHLWTNFWTWPYVARGQARPAYKRAFAAQLAVFTGHPTVKSNSINQHGEAPSRRNLLTWAGATRLVSRRISGDYGRRRIVFVPTPQSSAPFSDRTSFGVTLVAADGDLHTYVVAGVRAGSPAETAGFHQNDVIAGIDDKSASQFALSELRAWLTQEGQHHIFHVVRGDARLDIAAAVHTASIER